MSWDSKQRGENGSAAYGGATLAEISDSRCDSRCFGQDEDRRTGPRTQHGSTGPAVCEFADLLPHEGIQLIFPSHGLRVAKAVNLSGLDRRAPVLSGYGRTHSRGKRRRRAPNHADGCEGADRVGRGCPRAP